jgi:hypothetical protein
MATFVERGVTYRAVAPFELVPREMPGLVRPT